MVDISKLKAFDRVTQVLSPFSGMNKIDPMILQNAANRGTKVHMICDCLILNLPSDIIEEDHKGYIESFKQWKEGKKFLIKPERFYDDELQITGEIDGIYEKDGEITLFDFKTSAAEGKTWNLQGSAYSYLARKGGFKISNLEFVKLCKKGKSPKIYQYEDDLKTFLMCLEIYRKFFKNAKDELDLDYI